MSDRLIQISTLISQVKLLRFLLLFSIIFVLLVISYVSFGKNDFLSFGNYVAKINISGEIVQDSKRIRALNQIANNKKILALILEINSPGGSASSSEELYNSILNISKSKPVVAVLQNVAASGGYMVSLAADHIIIHNSTITGSIGVIARYVGVTELANKLGITLKSIKSSDLKGAMSPFEQITPEAESSIKDLINDSYTDFVTLVAERRKMDIDKVFKIADGRVYSASRALRLGLVDEIGGEKEALDWLKNRNINIKNIKNITLVQLSNYLKNNVFNMLGNINELSLMFSLF